MNQKDLQQQGDKENPLLPMKKDSETKGEPEIVWGEPFKKSTPPETSSWGSELGQILADFEQDKNEVKAINNISELCSSEYKRGRFSAYELIHEYAMKTKSVAELDLLEKIQRDLLT